MFSPTERIDPLPPTVRTVRVSDSDVSAIRFNRLADTVTGSLGSGKRYLQQRTVTRAALIGAGIEQQEFGTVFTAPEGMSRTEFLHELYG